MRSLHFIGGEKGGVGKSVVSRLLAQHCIDQGLPFTGFDTDRSHTTFSRFYADHASPVVVDTYEGLDQIATLLTDDAADPAHRAVVDLAAQTAAPLARWVHDTDLLGLMAELGIAVNFWHVADAGHDSVDLLARLLATYGQGPNYIVVKNRGRGSDFSELDASPALQQVLDWGGQVVSLAPLHEASMRKLDRQNTSFWAATRAGSGPDALGLLERQRVKTWLTHTTAMLNGLPL